MAGDFTAEQKRYLEGFASGFQASRATRGPAPTKDTPIGPDAIHFEAQDRAVARGGKLNDQEKIKREQHPFDAYARLVAQAKRNEPPKPADNFRWRYHGLFYVAPTQTSYMCRLRIPNGVLTHWQFAGLADLADRHGGGYLHVTTRANLQIREIEPQQRRRHDRRRAEPRPVDARRRRRQYSQHHRNADRRRRSARAHRHASAGARAAFSYSQRSLALRPAAQIQHRFRRRRPHRRARGHQ